jgi:hypothetical protein
MATDDSQQGRFTADSALTREEIEQRNLEVVAAHFHNENPDDVDKAIALYAPDICWETLTVEWSTPTRLAYLVGGAGGCGDKGAAGQRAGGEERAGPEQNR